MPVGIITNICAVAAAGVLGGWAGKHLPKRITGYLVKIIGFCSITIGITSLQNLNSLTVVILSILLGSVIGAAADLDKGIAKLISGGLNLVYKKNSRSYDPDNLSLLCTVAAIVCFSGTGIFGAICEGLDGNSSILLAKSVMDFFSVSVFAVQLGMSVSLLAFPQTVVFLTCFFAASMLSPLFTAAAVGNFKAAGGILTLLIGYNLLAEFNGWKKIGVMNMIPCLAVVLLISRLCEVFALHL